MPLKFLRVGVLALLGVLLLVVPGNAATSGEWTKNQFSEKGSHGHPKFSDNGEYLVVLEQRGVASTGKVWLLSADSGQTVWKFNEKKKSYYDADISDDGSYIAAAGGELALFSKDSGAPLWRFSPKGTVYNRVAMSGNGQYIAVGTRSGEVRLFKNDAAKELYKWKVCKDSVEALAISNDGNYIVAGGLGKMVLIQRDRNAIINTYDVKKKNGKADKVMSVAISGDGQKYTAATYDGLMYLFDRDYSKPFWTANSGTNVKLRTAVSDNGNNIVLVSDRKYWGFTADSAKSKWNFVNKGRFPDLDMSTSGKYIAVADAMNTVYVFDRDFTNDHEETRPIRTYDSVFPGSISMSGQGDKIVYDEKAGLKFRAVSPSVLTELKDSVAVYRTDDTMQVRTFVSDPGGPGDKLYKLEVHLSLPQMDFWKIAGRAVKKKLESVVPKEISNAVSKLAGDQLPSVEDSVPYAMPVGVVRPGSFDQTLNITVPKLNGEAEDKGWMGKFDIIGKAFGYFNDLLKEVLPANMANWITDATKAYFTGESSMQSGMQPSIGLGQVFLKDYVTGEVIDSDTFVFVYIMEG